MDNDHHGKYKTARILAEQISDNSLLWVETSENFNMDIDAMNKTLKCVRRFVHENVDGGYEITEEILYYIPKKGWQKNEYRSWEIIYPPMKRGVKIKIKMKSPQPTCCINGAYCMHVDSLHAALEGLLERLLRQTGLFWCNY